MEDVNEYICHMDKETATCITSHYHVIGGELGVSPNPDAHAIIHVQLHIPSGKDFEMVYRVKSGSGY